MGCYGCDRLQPMLPPRSGVTPDSTVSKGRRRPFRRQYPDACFTAAAAALVLALTGCTSGAAEPDLEELNRVQETLHRSITQEGHELYGSAGAVGGRETSITIDVGLGRAGLTVTGLCRGGEGTALVTLNEDGPYELPCGKEAGFYELTSALPLEGIRLPITVEGAPEGSTWAVAASSGS